MLTGPPFPRRSLLASAPLRSALVGLCRPVVSLVFVLLCALALPFEAAWALDPAALGAAGPHSVTTRAFDLFDARRGREVPIKAYVPADVAGRCPTIVFSHGMGGSREAYGFLGRHWASHGFVALHLQHRGIDDVLWRGVPIEQQTGRLREAFADRRNHRASPLDATFVIDTVLAGSQGTGDLAARVDRGRLAMAGHSFGAQTTMAVAGQLLGGASGPLESVRDPRIQCALAMSAPVPQNGSTWRACYAPVAIPVFHMTGTHDESPIGETTTRDRRVPYDHTVGSPHRWLVTYAGGDHMIFSRRSTHGGPFAGTTTGARDPEFRVSILQLSTAFFEAQLKHDPTAIAWLDGEGLQQALNGLGSLERPPQSTRVPVHDASSARTARSASLAANPAN